VSRLGEALADYLSIRRALGYKLDTHGRLLADFVSYLDRAGHTTVTTDLALAWAARPTHATPAWWAARLAMVRQFAAYQAALDPATQVPPADLLPHRTRRSTPDLCSDAEISDLLSAAARLRPPFRAATYTTLFGLLAVTGMRVGEALRLGRDDLDDGAGQLLVKRSKFNKSRLLPLHPSVVNRLTSYARQRERLHPRPKTVTFFASTAGTQLIYNNVRVVFGQLTTDATTWTSRPRRPRIHGLRHSFAVATLLDWYRAGVDVDARLPLLSAYLGHVDPAATYWYLQAAPALLALAAQRLDAIGQAP
jgi:integrase/recombinase XerD